MAELVIVFCIGLFVGVVIGVTLMAVLQISRGE
jgi:uncharacterized membrane-anchored protein YhcB (DUF1043 family)